MLQTDSNKPLQTYVREVPVTCKRIPYISSEEKELVNPGTARANFAPTVEAPQRTQSGGWAAKHRRETVLQQHVNYFDPDGDGVVWPLDTYRGFHNLGFNIILSLLAVFIIHANFSYPTSPSLLPDPFFRVRVADIHKAKHGSDTGAYDNEGRFLPQKFEDIFSKYAADGKSLNKWEIWNILKGQRVLLDPIGWFGAFFEWLSLYILLWPDDGAVRKEDVRRVYDGSIFPELSMRRSGKSKAD
ncbi:predicted protein [Postia placenta Mad-698-R]|nr:predicted protein [Postia placenta Mad-698-R]